MAEIVLDCDQFHICYRHFCVKTRSGITDDMIKRISWLRLNSDDVLFTVIAAW